ncbi:MAG: UPF0179 family protein [Candidatus Asgardarchaeia archaeon]
MAITTLIGKALAKKGNKFLYVGDTMVCKNCEYYKVCQENLERKRVYEIVDVKNVEHPCNLHDGGSVVLVEVKEAEIETLIPSKKAIEGGITEFSPVDCTDINCKEYRELCQPLGLFKGDKVQIVKVLEKISCGKGKSFSKVIVRRLHDKK